MEIYKQKLLLIEEQSFKCNQKIRTTLDIVRFMNDILQMNEEAQEVIYLFTLNAKNELTGFVEIARRRE